MKLTFSLIASMALLLAGCNHSNVQSLYEKEVTIPPGKAHYKEFFVNAGQQRCEIALRTAGEERVDFAILRRQDFNAYKAGTGPVPVAIMSRTNVNGLDTKSVPLSRGEYLLSVHNFTQNPVVVTLKYRFSKV